MTNESIEVIDDQFFTVSRPYNDTTKEAIIRGYELAWFQTFDEFLPEPLAGFGIYANYSYNNSESGDLNNDGTERPFYGLSKNQYNVNCFYEQHGLTANVSYNYRDSFLAYDSWYWSNTIGGWTTEEGNETDWEALDVSLSYEINDNLTVTLEGNNLLDPDWLQHSGNTPANVLNAASYGKRYSAGIRYKF